MDKYSTPEERLLLLIRRKDQKQAVKVEAGIVAGDTSPVKLSWLRQKKLFSFNFFNGLLIIIVGILVFYILFEFLFAKNGQTKISTTPVPKFEGKHMAAEDNKIKPYSYYSSQFEKRDIFEIASSESDIFTPGTASANIQQLIQDLKLVGVILDNNPQAIIESKTENKTYFLHRGESVRDFKVEVINESKVILSCGQEKFELAL